MRKMRLTSNCLLWICFVAIMIIGISGILLCSRSYELDVNLWYPPKLSFANLVEGEYTPVKNVSLSGTAIFLPLERYQKLLLNAEHTVIVKENGHIYYLTNVNEKIYVSEDRKLVSDKTILNMFRSKKVSIINFDTGIATISQKKNVPGVVAAIFIWLIASLLMAVGIAETARKKGWCITST